MGVGEHSERVYRVIAEGDDAVGVGLSIVEAVDVVKVAREARKRHVAILGFTAYAASYGATRRVFASSTTCASSHSPGAGGRPARTLT